jgi:SAM-dependent methyltransferase
MSTHGHSAAKRRLGQVVQSCAPTTNTAATATTNATNTSTTNTTNATNTTTSSPLLCFENQASVVHPGVAGGPPLSYTPMFYKHLEKDVISKFLQLEPDASTNHFLKEYCMGGESIFTDAMAHVLKWMSWSRTDINATLGRGQMYVISAEAVRKMLSKSGCSATWRPRSILDVGAGDGNVTSTALEPLLHVETNDGKKVEHTDVTIVTTEVSGPMATCLRKRGYICLETTDLSLVKNELIQHASSGGTYDLISIFNVLDRADKPQSLLYDIRQLLTPSIGRCIISVVLPFCPFVETGQKQMKPTEDLNMNGGRCMENASFERAVDVMITNVFIPSGFTVHSWSKIPYICSGDRTTPYYVLYDAVFVLSCTRRA